MHLQRVPGPRDLMFMPARRLCRGLLRVQAKPSLGGLAQVQGKHTMYTAAVAAQPLGTGAEPGAQLADVTPGFAILGLDERVLVSISQRHSGGKHVLQPPGLMHCRAPCQTWNFSCPRPYRQQQSPRCSLARMLPSSHTQALAR